MNQRTLRARVAALAFAAAACPAVIGPGMISGIAPGIASADVLISSVGEGDAPVRVLIGADMARIDAGGERIHIDLRSGKMYAIDEAAGYAMDMSTPIPARPEHGELDTAVLPPPAVRFERRGAGPSIAGYATEHYRVSVDGRHCYDEYLAPAALRQPEIRRFIEALSAASRNDERRVLMQLTDPARLCEAADDIIDDSYVRLGIPLRTENALGRLVHQVTAIDGHAPHDAALLQLPAGYEILTRAEVMARTTPAVDRADIEKRRRELEQHMREFGDPGVSVH